MIDGPECAEIGAYVIKVYPGAHPFPVSRCLAAA
jgi:hypothetical protein